MYYFNGHLSQIEEPRNLGGPELSLHKRWDRNSRCRATTYSPLGQAERSLAKGGYRRANTRRRAVSAGARCPETCLFTRQRNSPCRLVEAGSW